MVLFAAADAAATGIILSLYGADIELNPLARGLFYLFGVKGLIALKSISMLVVVVVYSMLNETVGLRYRIWQAVFLVLFFSAHVYATVTSIRCMVFFVDSE